MRPVTALMLGAGNRGHDAYGAWALAHPAELRFVAVAESDPAKRERFARAHGIGPEGQFETWADLLRAAPHADAAVNALPDAQHEASAVAALRAGYHLLLEKPVAPDLAGTLRVLSAARQSGRVVMLGYVLRHAPLFQAVRDVVRSGRLGQTVNLAWRENVHALHFAHSYVRGNWAVEAHSSPFLLAKASHDLDLLGWITGLRATHVSSFGNLLHFRPEHAPEGAPDRCLDGCPAAESCAFYAPRTYLSGNTGLSENTGWPASVISPDPSLQAREAALHTGPYGRCVYHAGNDVPDHQVVGLQFEGGATGTLTAHGHSATEGRTVRIDGTRATLRATFTATHQEVTVHDHDAASFRGESQPETIPLHAPSGMAGGGHGGGDAGLTAAFVNAVRSGHQLPLDLEFESHVLAFAAEHARHAGTVVDLEAFRAALPSETPARP